ncbi:MAG TPA: hypothetical protein VGI15_00255, partial [Candidatus Cybelea sp.]
HLCGFELFENATFYVQQSELDFWSARSRRDDIIMGSVDRQSLEALETLDARGRLQACNGPIEFWPGLRAVPVGGHTPGLQVLVVETQSGNTILASDALHFYENYERRRPVQVTLNLPDALDAFDHIEKLAEGGRVIAGHDALTQTFGVQRAEHVFQIA